MPFTKTVMLGIVAGAYVGLCAALLMTGEGGRGRGVGSWGCGQVLWGCVEVLWGGVGCLASAPTPAPPTRLPIPFLTHS